jgi:parallel beta-helix repeat protein
MSRMVSGIMLAVLVISLPILTAKVEPVKAGLIIVPDYFPTIQEAINNAYNGDTIFVRSGTYYENVVVNKMVSLVGEDESSTVIDGMGIGTTVQVTASNVTLSGFTIQDSSNGYLPSGSLSGIQIYRSSGNNISHNVIRGNYVGISLRQSSENTLTANIAHDNWFNFAVDVSGDSSSQFDNYVDTSNTVDGKSIYYLKDESNVVLGARSNAGTIYLINCKNITVQDLTLTKNYFGVFLWNTTGSYITNVTAMDNWGSGIRLEQSSNNTIIHNRLSNQEWDGITLIGSESNLIMSNDASYNWNDGIYSLESSHNQIVYNVLSHTFRGLYLIGFFLINYSDDNYVADNLFSNDFEAGAIVYASGCTLLENVFKENAVGIDLAGDKNVIYHNNFIQNGIQVRPVNQYKNAWDNGYPSGGNYWSDYNGTDLQSGPYQNETGSDGIGDTAYVIGTNNRDNYPLMKLSPSAVIGASITVEPAVLNLKGKGIWVTAYIELPEGYDVVNINVSTIMLNSTISAELAPTAIEDYANNGILDLMVKFNRTAISELILSKGILQGNVTLDLTGQLNDGMSFEGTAVIRVRMPGDVNMDGAVDGSDLVLAARAFGSYPGHPRWNPLADENEDGVIDGADLILITRNFGKAYP